jgi:hypothetical protein
MAVSLLPTSFIRSDRRAEYVDDSMYPVHSDLVRTIETTQR